MYKDEPGHWQGVRRFHLFDGESSAFQGRYFEVAPGGFSSHEVHRHEHFVLVVRGRGRVRLGDAWHDVAPMDVVIVGPELEHQFVNPYDEPLGFLCVVDRVRDRGRLLGNAPPLEALK